MVVIPRRRVELSAKEIFFAFMNLFRRRGSRKGLISEFENQFANFIGVKHAIAMPSARIGLAVFLDEMAFEKDDEVIMSSYNYHVVAALFKHKGLKPVFVDVSERTWNIAPDLITKKITSKTKMIVATHLYGRSCDMDKLMAICHKHNIMLIEDVAHACGGEYKNQKLGSFGDVSFFSFGTGKALVTLKGSILTTNNKFIASSFRRRLETNGCLKKKGSLGDLIKPILETVFTKNVIFSLFIYPMLYILNCFGFKPVDEFTEDKYVFEEGSININKGSFTWFQAALGIGQLKRLEDLNKKRMLWGATLNKLLDGIQQIQLPSIDGSKEHISLYYGIVAEEAKELRKYLFFRGVDTKMGSMRACSALDFFQSGESCPVAERISSNIVELPCYPSLNREKIYYLNKIVREFYQKS